MSESLPPNLKSCPQCGAELPADGMNGLCPACLLAEAMKPSGPKTRWEPPSVDELASHFPPYEIQRILGRGGMGAVYLARQISLNRLVAIKILPADIDDGFNNFAERFKNEAQAMAQLSHPGIVAVFDFGETADGLLYIVMEYIDGTDVQQMVAQQGRLHSAHAMAITAHVCDALAYAHSRGIIHRDIKPSNIMVSNDGVVKVADFGLAKMSQGGQTASLTQSGMAMGTLHFMAPEALTLGSAVDQRADIYAVGVMLYQMLTGKLPQGMFELPSLQVPGLDPRYDGIVAKALREDRAVRYQQAIELRHDLDAILTQPVVKVEPEADQAPVAVPPPAAKPQRPAGQPYRPPQRSAPPPPKKKSPAGLIIAGLALFVLIAAGVFFLLGKGGSASLPAQATTDKPFVNSLGMKFVPVPIIGGPTSGKTVLFSVWETRVQDYTVFAAEKQHDWSKPNFAQEPLHPVVNISWDEAQAFCLWLTERERKAGKLGTEDRYRLPSDHEWSCAVGVGEREDPAKQPSEKSEKLGDVFPWGSAWPPPPGTGNYAGEELQAKISARTYPFIKGVLSGYRDDYLETAPVGSFPADELGLYDLSGNAREWCDDWWDASKRDRVLRGGSWGNEIPSRLLSSHRDQFGPSRRYIAYGFRVVLEAADSVSASADTGWAFLFPNDSLIDWTGDVAGYRLANGILTSTAKGGDLISPKEYGSFHLKFDLRLSSGGNNGIGVWCADNNQGYKYRAQTGFEIQLIDDASPTYTKGNPWHLHGALSFFIAPKAKPLGPLGTWNSHEIRMDGTRLTVIINDVTVIDQELPTGDPVAEGSRKNRLDLTKKRGHLVFCGMKGPVDFRNVMIKELP